MSVEKPISRRDFLRCRRQGRSGGRARLRLGRPPGCVRPTTTSPTNTTATIVAADTDDDHGDRRPSPTTTVTTVAAESRTRPPSQDRCRLGEDRPARPVRQGRRLVDRSRVWRPFREGIVCGDGKAAHRSAFSRRDCRSRRRRRGRGGRRPHLRRASRPHPVLGRCGHRERRRRPGGDPWVPLSGRLRAVAAVRPRSRRRRGESLQMDLCPRHRDSRTSRPTTLAMWEQLPHQQEGGARSFARRRRWPAPGQTRPPAFLRPRPRPATSAFCPACSPYPLRTSRPYIERVQQERLRDLLSAR